MDEKKTPSVKKFPTNEAIGFGFDTSKKNISFFFSVFVIIIFINVLLVVIQQSFQSHKDLIPTLLSLAFGIVRWIFGMVVGTGLIKIALQFVDGKKPKVSDLFYKDVQRIIYYFLASFITGIIILGGFILFIIPGIIFAIKLQFVTYLVIDKNMGPIDAIKKSWDMTKGVKLDLFIFGILLAFINLLGLLALVIGLIITVPLGMVATAYVYRKLLS